VFRPALLTYSSVNINIKLVMLVLSNYILEMWNRKRKMIYTSAYKRCDTIQQNVMYLFMLRILLWIKIWKWLQLTCSFLSSSLPLISQKMN